MTTARGLAGVMSTPDPDFIKRLRDRAWKRLSPDDAAAADMSLAELQQFCIVYFHPTEHQLKQLALRMGVRSAT